MPQVTIADVFDAVARGRADYGVVPIENCTEGAVNHTLDVFMESDLRICAQILMKIENHLAAKIPRRAKSARSTRTRRSSGSAASGSGTICRTSNSSKSAAPRARPNSPRSEPHAAALVGAMAAEVHGLHDPRARPCRTIRTTPRASSSSATTRSPPTGDDRTSLMFCVQDKPGALFAALEPFNRAEDQHEQDRKPPLEAQGVGVFLLRRYRRPRRARPRSSRRSKHSRNTAPS